MVIKCWSSFYLRREIIMEGQAGAGSVFFFLFLLRFFLVPSALSVLIVFVSEGSLCFRFVPTTGSFLAGTDGVFCFFFFLTLSGLGCFFFLFFGFGSSSFSCAMAPPTIFAVRSRSTSLAGINFCSSR